MKNKLLWIIAGAILVMVFSFCFLKYGGKGEPITDNGFANLYVCVQDKLIRGYCRDGICEFYLPDYTDYESAYLCFDDLRYDIRDGNKVIHSGDSLSKVISESFKRIKVYKGSEITSVFINTKDDSLDYLKADKSHVLPGNISLVSFDGRTGYDGRIENIRTRGHSSFSSTDKKSYRFKLRKKAALLSDNETKEYRLIANFTDITGIRTQLAFDLAKTLGLKYPAYEQVDLYIDGKYEGLYLLTETTSEDKMDFQVEITRASRIEGDEDKNVFPAYDDGSVFIVNYNQGMSEQDIMEIMGNPMKYADTGSFSAMYIHDFLLDDVDANYASTFYEGSGGVLYASPVWDYDRALGSEKENGDPMVNSYSDGLPETFYKNSANRSRISKRYKAVSEHLDYLLSDGIDAMYAVVAASNENNFRRWEINGRINTEKYVELTPLSENVTYLKWYFGKRRELLDKKLENVK